AYRICLSMQWNNLMYSHSRRHSMKTRLATRRRWNVALAWVLLLALSTMLLSACGGNAQLQQQASQSKKTLDADLAHARSIGITDSLLAPIVQQEQQLAGAHAPLGVFSDQPVDTYYQ